MADEKEVTIKVTTETDTANLEELDSLIEEIQEKSQIEASVEVDDSSVTDALDDTEQLNDDLNEIDGMTVSPDVDTSGLQELSAEAEEATSSLDSLGTAAAGVAASAGVDQMIETADRINTSWNQLELTFGSVTDAMKADISEAAAATGRSGGEIRGYFNQMGIAGVTNTDLLTSSFEALSGKAYQTGNSIESMETKLQRMVMTGNASGMMLQKLGIDVEDLAAAMGVSADQVSEAFKNLTPEERLQAITKAMGDGAEANEMYKNSYAGLKAQADAAMAGLMGAVGQAILPVVIPALQAATNFVKLLTDGFNALPAPVQWVVGGLMGFAAISLTLIGVLGTIGQVVSMVQGGLAALNLITKLSTVATYAQTAAQWALNVAMDANPVMLVVIALIALAAALIWAYENVDWFREAVDNLGAAIGGFVSGALASLQSFTSNLAANVINWTQSVLSFILFIPQLPMRLSLAFVDAVAKVLGFGNNFSSTMRNAASTGVSNFMNYISSLPSQFWNELQRMINDALNFAGQIGSILWNAGVNAVTGFLNGLQRHSPGKMQRELIAELTETGERVPIVSRQLISNVGNVGEDITNAFNPTLGIGAATSNGYGIGGDTVINIYGDVDSDKRVQQIIDVIRNELNWNNVTAGRTV